MTDNDNDGIPNDWESANAVEASTDLGATGWNIVKASVPSGGETTTTTIPVPTGSPLQNFYRVKLKP